MPEYANSFAISCTVDGHVHPAIQNHVLEVIQRDFERSAKDFGFPEGAKPTLRESGPVPVPVIKRDDGGEVDYDAIPDECWDSGDLPEGYHWGTMMWVKHIAWYYNTDF